MSSRKRIGQIFVEQGIITEKTLERALERAKRQGRRVGYVLEDMGVVTGEELAEALAFQFGWKRVSDIEKYQYPPDVLGMITADTALRYLIFPLKKEGGKLLLAMADPTDDRIVVNLAKNQDVTVVPVVAARVDIIRAINRHYIGKDAATDGRKKVLIAEDSPAVSSELSDMLSREGYRIITARDGIEAFKLAISEYPQVIVTDKEMPVFGGYRLLESIQNLPETKHIPVLLLTATLNSEDEANAYDKGFFDYMSKPVKAVTLITKVKRAIKANDDARRLG